MRAFAFKARSEGKTLELDVFGVVGDSWFGDSVSAGAVRRMLKANRDATLIKVRINSDGGDAFEGFAIYNLLSEHPARVEVDVDALCCSAASIIAMAGDEIRMAHNAWMMIHNAWGGVHGEPEDMRRWADVLEKVSDQSADIYAARTKQPKAKVAEMMGAETWMTASEAKALGFCDKVQPLKAAAAKASAQASNARAFACMSLDDFENVPDAVREAVKAARADQAQQALDLATTTSTPAPSGPASNPTGEETRMEDTLKAFCAANGIEKPSDLTARLGLLAKLEAALGKPGEAAHGVALAAVQALQELPAVRTRVTELEAKQATADFEAVIVLGKDPKGPKLTPASEAALRKQFADKAITLEGARAMVEALPAIPALKTEGGTVTPPVVTGTGDLTHNGKKFADMNGAERAQLRKEDRAKYDAMRDAHQAQS